MEHSSIAKVESTLDSGKIIGWMVKEHSTITIKRLPMKVNGKKTGSGDMGFSIMNSLEHLPSLSSIPTLTSLMNPG